MKKVVFLSAVAAILLFSGCSQKEQVIDATQEQAVEEVAPVATETVVEREVVVDEPVTVSVTEADTHEVTMSDIEKRMQTINFDFDMYNIRADMEDKMRSNVEVTNGDAAEYVIKLEGNCDEWGSDEYNYALGLRRTNSVKSAMVQDGVDAKRITMVSYGESKPVCTDKNKDCWAKNRRVDFVLLP